MALLHFNNRAFSQNKHKKSSTFLTRKNSNPILLVYLFVGDLTGFVHPAMSNFALPFIFALRHGLRGSNRKCVCVRQIRFPSALCKKNKKSRTPTRKKKQKTREAVMELNVCRWMALLSEHASLPRVTHSTYSTVEYDVTYQEWYHFLTLVILVGPHDQSSEVSPSWLPLKYSWNAVLKSETWLEKKTSINECRTLTG